VFTPCVRGKVKRGWRIEDGIKANAEIGKAENRNIATRERKERRASKQKQKFRKQKAECGHEIHKMRPQAARYNGYSARMPHHERKEQRGFNAKTRRRGGAEFNAKGKARPGRCKCQFLERPAGAESWRIETGFGNLIQHLPHGFCERSRLKRLGEKVDA